METFRRDDPGGDRQPGLCEGCLRLPEEESDKNDCFSGPLNFLAPLSCPLCCNYPFGNMRLNPVLPPWHQSKSCSVELPEGHVILWRSCSGCAGADCRKSGRYKFGSAYSDSGQWSEIINFTTNFRDYKKIFPSCPGIGRYMLIALLMVTLPLTLSMSPPPNYSHANMPNTSFTCSDKATGGYYADPQAGCQMFHVCVRISDEEMNDFRFLCPNDTVFDQQNFICTNWWDIDCERSTRFYSKNDLFREPGEQPTEYEYETPETSESPESPVYYEYVYEYEDLEGTTEDPAAEKPSQGRHRLNLEKEESEKPKGRSVEPSSLTTTEIPRIFEVTTNEFPWHTASRSVSVTTSASTTRDVSHTSRSTTSQKKNYSSSALKSNQVAQKPATEPTSYFHFGSTLESNSSVKEPSNAFEIQRFNSRGGSPYQDSNSDSDKQSSKIERNETRQPDLDSDDPFANYEWKKESSSVTASAKTRYETLFGETNRKARGFADKDQTTTEPSLKSSTDTPTSLPPSGRRNLKRGSKSKEQQDQNQKLSSTEPPSSHQQDEKDSQEPSSTQAKHKEFSNFRFYKTAFGRSYSSDDFLGKGGNSTPQIRISDPVRLQRTASRNTRYSIYG